MIVGKPRKTAGAGQGRRPRGTELMEFALASLFWLPILLGTFVTGMNLIRANQCSHLVRSIGSMYIHGVDFSLTASKDLAVRLARGLNLQNGPASGDGVIILSQATFVGDATCAANGLAGLSCTNRNQYVLTQRLTIGNASLRTSSVGTPTATINGAGMVQNYVTDSGAIASSGFASLWNPQLADGQYVYAVEGYFTGTSLAGINPSGGMYSRHFF
jgi:hypothetical protein